MSTSSAGYVKHKPHLPVEIWREIFTHAASISGKDELSLDGASYYPKPCDEPSASSILNNEELVQIIDMRYSIIRVCKFWYFIGLEALWSHLCFRCDKYASYTRRVHPSLLKRPELATFVRRLSVKSMKPSIFPGHWLFQSSSDKWMGQVGSDLLRNLHFISNDILPLLSSLKIISWPLVCGIDQYKAPLQAEVTIFEPSDNVYPNSRFAETPSSLCWNQTRVLIVDFGKASVFGPAQLELTFPQLEFLWVNVEETYQINRIATKWKLPRLQTLTIRGRYAYYFRWMLEKHNRIKKLELILFGGNHSEVPTLTVLPNLTHLYIGAVDERLCRLQAPKLECFGIFNIGVANSLDALNLAHEVNELFPSARRVRLSTTISDGIGPLEELGEERDRFREKGIELQVTTEGRAWYQG